MSGVLVKCVDGPVAGAAFTVSRCPQMVRCVITPDGATDILNLPEDLPRLDETVHWYRWDGRAAGYVCGRGAGCHAVLQLVHAPEVDEREDG